MSFHPPRLLPTYLPQGGIAMSATLVARLRRWFRNSGRENSFRRGVSLNLEALETRLVPSNAPVPPPASDVFLATVYQGELQRPIDAAGLAYWDAQLSQGVSRAQVAGAILNSEEFFRRIVSTDYNALLGRDADAGGLQLFVQALLNGATPQNVKATILASDEFFTRVGGNSATFVNAVYGEELGRPVDTAGLAYWTPLAFTVAGRTGIAQAVGASPEATHIVVATLYQDTLGRVPDASGLAFWSGQLQMGASTTAVLTNLLGSNEFFARVQSYIAPLNTSDPNVAAATFITEAQLFKSQPVVVPPAPPMMTPPSGDNSGYDVPPGDNTGGDVLGGNNSGSVIVIPDTSVPPPPVIDTTVPEMWTTDTTDYSSCCDCCCNTTDYSVDTGASSVDTSSDPGTGY
jgi:hypothetical protein